MPKGDKLSRAAVLKLPPMLWGRIRWNTIMGSPVGDPATGFRVFCEEHTATQFRIGRAGPEPIPGTGIWKPAVSVPCFTAPDEGQMHVVAFRVPDVHLTMFPDGKYRVRAELTGNWGESMVQIRIGYRRIDPLAHYVVLTQDKHLESVSFEVLYEHWHWRP